MTYEEFMAARLQPLLRYATMLTGDAHLAADLVQEVMVRVQLKWRRVAAVEVPDLYVRDFCVDYSLTSIHTGHSFAAGCRHFDGADATDYLRQRIDIRGSGTRLGGRPPDRADGPQSIALLTLALESLAPPARAVECAVSGRSARRRSR